MPWVYTLQLTEFRDAQAIQTDWEDNIPGNAKVENDYGGVTVSGDRCVIVSQRNNPEFEEMANMDYVKLISEHKEIASDVKTVKLGHGIRLDRL